MRLTFALLLLFITFCLLTQKSFAEDDSLEDDIVFGKSPDEDFIHTNKPKLDDKLPANVNQISNQRKNPMDIKNDLSKQNTPPNKPKNQLAQDFENDPANFQNPKNSLEQDGGYFAGKKNAEKNGIIPKYPDRSNNKGLVRDLFSTLNNTNSKNDPKDVNGNNKMPPSPQQIAESMQVDIAKNDTSSVSIGGFFKNIVSKTKQIFTAKEEIKKVQPKKKINLADRFPDPTFYKVQRTDKYYKIPISVLNDKTNTENSHIPSVDLNQDYKILFLLFQKIKTDTNQNEIRAMLDAIKNKNLINTKDNFGNTLLNYAVRFNNIQCFHSLMDYGADPNICNNSGICPIHLAIFNYQNYIFDLLLKANTKYDIKDNSGFDPLIYAIYAGNMHVFLKLLEIPPYNNLKRSDYQYLLNIADESENYAIYEYILNKSR